MNDAPTNNAPTDDVFVFPASFSQERLWFLDQFAPGTPVYNVAGVTPLPGWLDVGALERSLNEIVRRHESLRTTFATVDGRPVQVIAPSLHTPLRVIDLQHLPPRECEAEAGRLAAAEAREPFDLARGPLLRATLLRRNQDHMLVLAIHHIVSDGWSLGVFFRELTALYDAFSAGRPSPLAELPLQYADFAEWQRQRLQGEALEKLLSYWRRQLKDAPAVLDLPTDRPRPAVQSFRGAVEWFTSPPAVVDALKALSRQEGATLFMTLLAAFNALLHRYTGLDDVVVGSPIANRNRPEIEGIIGFFVNTLVLRTDLSGGPTFRELLRRVCEVTLGAYAHQDLPFEKLVEEVKPERRLNHNPLFQVMFVFQNTPMAADAASDQDAPVLSTGTAKFDLTMFLMEADGGLSGAIEYNTDIFDAATIKRAAGHFKTLLSAAARTPELRLSELPLLDDGERRQLMVEWNRTERAFTADGCLQRLVEMQADRSPDAAAAVFGGRRLTYRQLNRRANELARRLRPAGVGPDVVVGVSVRRSFEMLVAVLGILKAGGAYLPLDPSYPRNRLAFMLEDARAPVLVTDRSSVGSFPGLGAEVLYADEIVGEAEGAPHVEVTPDNLAYVIYTSGSTGRPKGVAMTHGALVNLISWQTEDSGAATTLQFTPLSFDVSCQELFATWAAGGTLVMLTEEERVDPNALTRAILETKVERLFLPPVALQQLADAANSLDATPTALREVITAGEQLRITPSVAGMFARLGDCVLRNHYGPTETHVATQFVLRGAPGDWPALPPVGRPIANTKLYILDRDMRPVPVGVPGALYIGGAALARGYLRRPDLTAERFLPDPFDAQPGGRLYSTGDLARYRPDGDVEFLGRTDHQMKVRGFRVEPGEIEALLARHPKVREAVVVAREAAPGGVRLVAYTVPCDAADAPAGDDLRTFLKAGLPEYMLPASFVLLDALPLTPSGKVDRRALPAPPAARPDLAAGFVAPRTPVEQELAGIYVDMLGLERVGIHDSFFELGGHSLLATQVISRIRGAFKVELPLRRMFEAPTIAELAVVVVRGQIESADGERAAEILARLEGLSEEGAALPAAER